MGHHGHAFQIVTRNNTSLRVVRVSASYTRPDKINNANYHASPRLSKLRLFNMDVIGTPIRLFQHLGITVLSTRLKNIFPDISTGLPCLLSYLPNLTTLHTWHKNSSAMVPSARIKRDFERYCPLLDQFKLEEHSNNIIVEFFTNIVRNVTRITYQEARITPEAIAAIVEHQATLKKVAHFYTRGFDYEKEEVLQFRDNKAISGEMMQEIPRRCSQLQRLNLHQHEMDMDVVESGEWACKDLRKLRIRVKELDTKEKILKAIALWRAGCWRRRQEQATGIKAAVEEEERLKADQSIEARVARHLLKFEHLQWVWLGFQTWTSI
ncbi:hypothetical protein BGX24_006383 [Mortierella sp. AD032]|nr:hypothetical protein BGX24_006383 [Mortierella sp. AD032]